MNWLLSIMFPYLINLSLFWPYSYACLKMLAQCEDYERGIDDCCDPKDKCLLEPEFELQKFCMRPAKLNSSCSENWHCKAIYGAKCSENSTCVCGKDFVEYDENLCVKKQILKKFELKRIQDYVCDEEVCELPANYQSKSGLRRESNSMYGEKCKDDLDCQSHNLSSTACIHEECRCRDGEQFDYHELACKTKKNGIGQTCSYGRNCSAPNSYCDEFDTCRCKQYHYYKNGTCVRDSSFECPKGYYFNPINKNCTRYAQALDDYCGINEGCALINMTNVVCKNLKCQCRGDRILINGECFLQIWGQCDWRNKEDCTIPHSQCSHDAGGIYRCYCVNWYTSNNRTLCLPPTPYLFGSCESDFGGNFYNNLRCNGTHRICKDNSVEIDGKCLPLLGGECIYDSECQVANSSCNEDTECQCSADHGYYESTDKKSCLKFAKEVGDSCADDKGCEKVIGSRCVEEKCQILDSSDVENSQ